MAVTSSTPTIWGLSPIQLHDRFWAARGVQVVRPGGHSEMVADAELFLLVDTSTLVVLQLRDQVEMLSWLKPRLAVMRIRDGGRREYREHVQSDEEGMFLRFERRYDGLDARLARAGLTPFRDVARIWQKSSTSSEGWLRLRKFVPASQRQVRAIPGRVFDATSDSALMSHVEYLTGKWSLPRMTIPRVSRRANGVWADRTASVARRASVLGDVWVGAGRSIDESALVVGPAILWDAPEFRPASEPVPWQELEPSASIGVSDAPRPVLPARPPIGKRLFDILFSLFALVLISPLFPLIAIAILIEDGWPIFFGHRRETVGGRQFSCLKFRSMCRDAERVKQDLASKNVSDGPQFHVDSDPRMTRVGRLLRRTQLDEVPQFLNVLAGHMSIVGPRPSPRQENQYCPAWREARLSIRPGITGLWQTRRTRAQGLDFQEWIRYDLQYVEKMSWRLDLWILWRTIAVVAGRGNGQ